MKRIVCLLLVLMLLLSGCGLESLLERQLPDPDILEYRDLRYFAQQMDEESYMNMCAYYEAALNFEQWCTLPYPMRQTTLEDLLGVLRYECPELMMVDMTREFNLITMADKVTKVEIPYAMTEREYRDMEQQTRAIIEELADQCQGLSDQEAEKLIYDYIVTNCVHDDAAQWSATAYGCLVEGKAKCDGISCAMKWALEEAGISSIIITGVPSDGGVGHAWNVVQLDGSWYDVDVTADVGEEEGTVPCYPAYNVAKDWVREAYVLDGEYALYFEIPGTDTMEKSYHYLTGCYVPRGEEDRLEELYAQAYENGDTFILQFEDQEQFEDLEEDLEARLEVLGNRSDWQSWSWTTLSVPDYRTILITAGE